MLNKRSLDLSLSHGLNPVLDDTTNDIKALFHFHQVSNYEYNSTNACTTSGSIRLTCYHIYVVAYKPTYHEKSGSKFSFNVFVNIDPFTFTPIFSFNLIPFILDPCSFRIIRPGVSVRVATPDLSKLLWN